MRALAIIGGVIFGVPALVGIGVQLYAAIVVANVAYDVNKSIAEIEALDQVPTGKYQVENVEGDRSLWSGYAALTRVAEPVDDRVVTFDVVIQIDDLLHPGEAPPEADFVDVFVNARANTVADAECASLLATLASQCTVRATNAYALSVDKGLYNISATLGFVQKEAFGAVKEKAKLAYREINRELGDGAHVVTVMPSSAAGQRQKFYKEVARLCGKLRKSEGNCAIYRVDIHASDKSGSTALEMHGLARFSYLQPVGS